MVAINYLNFDLLIERVEARYKARILDSPGGQAVGYFNSPFCDEDLKKFFTSIAPNQGRPESSNAITNMGGRLFNAVFKDLIGTCFRSSLDETKRQGVGLRIRLHLNDAPELSNWPWEYLFDSSLNRFFSLSKYTPIVRYLSLPERIPSLTVQLRNRLVMCGIEVKFGRISPMFPSKQIR